MRRLRDWREVIFQELIILGFVSSGVLIVVDWLFPATRMWAAGLFLGMVSCTGTVVLVFRKEIVETWKAGVRAERRRAALEDTVQPTGLTIVHRMARQ